MRKARILLAVMDDDGVQPPAKRGGPAQSATVRQFFRARNAPRGTLEITGSGSAKLRDGERTEANPSEFERDRGRDYNGFILPRKGVTVLLGNRYFVDDSVAARWN